MWWSVDSGMWGELGTPDPAPSVLPDAHGVDEEGMRSFSPNQGSVSAWWRAVQVPGSPGTSAALGMQGESVQPAAGMLQASLGFPCGSGCS